MSFQNEEESWDFTPVINLNYSLSSKREAYTGNTTSSSPSSEDLLTPGSEDGQDEVGGQLGDFDKIWEFLGRPHNVPPPIVPPLSDEALSQLSKGANDCEETLIELSNSKGVRWWDEDGETGVADGLQNLALTITPQLSKARKKKLGAKRAKWANLLTQVESRSNLQISSSGTETEDDDGGNAPSIQSRSSVIFNLLHGTTPERKTTEQGVGSATKSGRIGPESAKQVVGSHRYPLRSLHKSPETPSKANSGLPEVSLGDIVSRRNKLVTMLHDRCVDERPYLGNLSLTPFAKRMDVSAESGLHVFIDASNIMIGLHDSLKIARGLSINSRMRRQPISFHNLSIVLERGRPTAKRVLVGSDNFPAIQEAKLLGYETNILDRVHKAKELTPRQRKYHNANGATSSGSETTAAVYAPEKWVEQAVDEILHLKILESVVDAEKPSTIVLATGDAAEAEYSQGFLKMVERALGKGWKVEVCSFKKNISGAYRKKEFRAKWASQFKIIEMDDFVEELIGVEL